MAIFRLSVSVVSRRNTGLPTTRSAIAAAAYQAREQLYDERRQVTYDLTADRSDLVHDEIMLPELAPYRWFDRETLWNEVEANERRADAQLARSVILTLPREMDAYAGADLARDFFQDTFVRAGMVADMAVHNKLARDGGPQPHAHALLTMRRIVDGAFGLKERAWNTAALLKQWREDWADTVNRRLAEHGVSARLDHRRWFVVGRSAPETSGQRQRDEARRRPIRDAARAVVRGVRRAADWVSKQREREPVRERDAVEAFRSALVDRGLRPMGDPVMDGRFHRVPVEGDRQGLRSGSYVGYLDGKPAGYIHNFKTGEGAQWSAKGVRVVHDPERLAAERAARSEEIARRQEAAADQGRTQWLRAVPAREHAYLTEKQVSGDGLRVNQRGDLLVPMRDVEGRLWGVQTITPDGEKLFGRGQRTRGTHMLIGELRPHEPVIIAEGYATARTIHEATGRAVAAAMNAGNLEAVALAYRARDPNRPIVIAADNDHHLPLREVNGRPLENVGLVKAEAAAQAVGGKVVAPAFALGDKGTDWNDYAKLHGGNDAVRRAFEREGIPMAERVAGAGLTQAEKIEVAETRARWAKIEASPEFKQMQWEVEQKISSLASGEAGKLSVDRKEPTQDDRDRARRAMPRSTQAVASADQQAQEASRRAQTAAERTHQATLG